MTTKTQQVVMCYHCHQKTQHTIIFDTKGVSEVLDFEPGNERLVETYFFLTKCNNCSEISLYTDWEESNDFGNLQEAILLYPNQKKYKESVPDVIVENYMEAKKVFKASPVAFVVLIRRCLEYICKDQRAVGRTLVEQLNDLVNKEVIPRTLSKMSNVLRFFGNIGAHATEMKLDYGDASIVDDFFTAIIEYVYVAPNKLQRVEKIINSKKVLGKQN